PAAMAPSAPAANDGAAQTAAASPAAASQTSGNEQAGVSTEASHKLPAIYFASNSVKVSPASKAALEEAAGLIRNLPRGSVVWINGYPDRPGNPARNIRLSRKRANAVRQALMDEGISPTTLIARGYPSSPPAIDNNESTGDRSSMAAKGKPGVEFRIVQQ
ncbi:MAG: OmpA family protein, partial [Methylocapsa sp.]|nr:OmpA family protein [Methylocapsa sp.]